MSEVRNKSTTRGAERIQPSELSMGLEIGSTRIKALLVDQLGTPLFSSSYKWENQLVDGIWTYSLDELWEGIQYCFSHLQSELKREHGVCLSELKSMGLSAMMHGYLVFDAKGGQLVPFRSWRNNITEPASSELTELFQYPIPQRWSIAHLYQAILNEEAHVENIASMTTLAGYVHWKLCGKRVLGIGEASGMFPIDIKKQDYNAAFIDKFDALINDRDFEWRLGDLMPGVLGAGEAAGSLSEAGARLLDPSGILKSGVPLCPPEGDAGTGMVATNSVEIRTGNVSAGTSVFAMLVLDKELSRLHPEVDLVTTPDGKLVGMVHSNNCTSDLNAWISLFGEVAEALGAKVEQEELFERLKPLALVGDSDCGGLLSYGYISGEHVTGFSEGRPLFVRSQDSSFTLANFMRVHLSSALCALRTGFDILTKDEGVLVDEIRGHGGFFKTPDAGQRIMAAALNTPVSVLETAGEGGAWGMALLASFMARENKDQTLSGFLNTVFSDSMGDSLQPDKNEVIGFNHFFERYQKGLPIERTAVASLS